VSTITLRLPDSKHSRLKEYAKQQGISLNELATVALAKFNAKTRFTIAASKGDTKTGLALLDKLDKELN